MRGSASRRPQGASLPSCCLLAVENLHAREEDANKRGGDGAPPAVTRGLDDLDVRMLRDTWWGRPDAPSEGSPFAELLWHFARAQRAKSVWASAGGVRAGMHYDSFDNLHVVVRGSKTFRLVAPSDA